MIKIEEMDRIEDEKRTDRRRNCNEGRFPK